MTESDLQSNIQIEQAQQLLGTLSRHRDDIRAAYLHKYRNCALELTRADTGAEQAQLEQNLQQLRHAQQLLLGESLIAASPTITQPPAVQSSGQEHKSSKPTLLLSSLLAVVITASALFSGYSISQQRMLQQANDQLVGQLDQQHQNLQQLQAQFTLSQEQQTEERRYWQTSQTQQQQQIAAQLELINQQHQLGQTLHQQLATLGKQLSAEQKQTLFLQQQVSQLNQQSDTLISELCNDSASIGPALDPAMLPAYLNRCRLLWSLAAE